MTRILNRILNGLRQLLVLYKKVDNHFRELESQDNVLRIVVAQPDGSTEEHLVIQEYPQGYLYHPSRSVVTHLLWPFVEDPLGRKKRFVRKDDPSILAISNK